MAATAVMPRFEGVIAPDEGPVGQVRASICRQAWSDAQEAMGQEAAAITLAAILERHDSIKNAGG
jgi:hypothetical protein